MKRMKKRMLALAAVLVLAVSMLTGCGGMTEEDAKEYVKATLDASYKADFDAYMEVTDSSKEEVQKLYDDNIENIVTSSGLQDMGITSELEEKYRELYKRICFQKPNMQSEMQKRQTEDLKLLSKLNLLRLWKV